MIESVTLRMGHAVHDDAFCVPQGMLPAWAERDPIRGYKIWLAEHVACPEFEDEELRVEVKVPLGGALRRAEASPLPDVASLTDGVYA